MTAEKHEIPNLSSSEAKEQTSRAEASPPRFGEGPGEGSEKHEIPKQTSPVVIGQGKGGGPKTAAGKAALARNSIKHGIMSNAPVVDGFETMHDWEQHLNGIVDSFAPQSALEEDLASRLATILWRLNRVTRYETASITLHIAKTRGAQLQEAAALSKLKEEPEDPRVLKAQIDRNSVPDDYTTDRLIKYETHLHRQSLQLLHEIEALQARRSGQHTPLARLDISAPPGASS